MSIDSDGEGVIVADGPDVGGMAMGAKATPSQITVKLVRPGSGTEDVALPSGTTLAEFLRDAGASAKDQEILIDSKPLAEAVFLRSGMVIEVARRPLDASGGGSWAGRAGQFRDDPAFEEMMRAVEEAREAEKRDP